MSKNMYVFFVLIGCSIGLMHGAEGIIDPKQEVLEQDLVVQEMEYADIDNIIKLFQKSSDIGSYTGISSDFSHYLHKDGYKVYLCKNKKAEDVYGFLLAVHQGDSFYVRALGVDKDCRRLGIATKLLKSAYGFAEQNNYNKLTIQASNENAKKCYEKFGFKIDSLTGCLTISFMKHVGIC
jgi:ribosomal protein S18 acetylase RimI-like enzyme